jgi:DNA-binding response OmpR family regulator
LSTLTPRHRGLREIAAVPSYDDGRLEIYPEKFLAYGDGRLLELTRRELALLVELRKHPGRTRTREELVEAVWGHRDAVSSRSVDVVILRLRDKLEAAVPDISYIQTSHGTGYGFDPQSEAEWDVD